MIHCTFAFSLFVCPSECLCSIFGIFQPMFFKPGKKTHRVKTSISRDFQPQQSQERPYVDLCTKILHKIDKGFIVDQLV